MTRRAWLFGFSGFFLAGSKAFAADVLTPVDETGFRAMVSAHRGKILLVDFWATWCAPCREEFPKLVALESEYRQKGLDLVTVSCDEREQEAEAAKFTVKEGAPMPRYVRRVKDDDAFINAIDPKWSGALPALFLFDRSGRQARSFIGETDMKALEAEVQKLLFVR